jgi:hypothetical protein
MRVKCDRCDFQIEANDRLREEIQELKSCVSALAEALEDISRRSPELPAPWLRDNLDHVAEAARAALDKHAEVIKKARGETK